MLPDAAKLEASGCGEGEAWAAGSVASVWAESRSDAGLAAFLPRRSARFVLWALLLGNSLSSPASPEALPPPNASGYIRLRDGEELHYVLWLPSGPGRFPIALDFDPYLGGSVGNVYTQNGWMQAGYALLGVNMRGTGCSSGSFDVSNAPQWGRDGAEVVAWAATQSWSSGHVGMFGASFPAVAELGTAEFAGPGLAAIAPFSPWTDLYRAPAYLGGIYNKDAVEGAFRVGQVNYSNAAIDRTDPVCVAHAQQRQQSNAVVNLAATLPAHPFFDDYYATHLQAYLRNIHLPVLSCITWQDSYLGSRAAEVFLEELDPASTWFVGSNGPHPDCATPPEMLFRFFDHFVKGLSNRFEDTPHVTLIHEVSTVGRQVVSPAGNSAGAATWVTTHTDWRHSVGVIRLRLHSNGRMDLRRSSSKSEGDHYAFPRPSAEIPSLWTREVPAEGHIAYTTPPLGQDLEIFGPASADLWVESTAADADLQVTVSEVRPDGQEMYVENGWLRASQRALDPNQSTALRPYQTHRPGDVAPLIPGVAVPVRVEIFPFDHVFRRGSAIRLTVDTPSQLMVASAAGTVTIDHDAGYDSELTLPAIPGAKAAAPLPSCAATAGQPCRPNRQAPPQGSLEIHIPTPER